MRKLRKRFTLARSVISAAQLRAARGALGWSASALAEASGLSLRTIQNIESRQDGLVTRKSSLLAAKAALEAAGIEFIGTPDDAPGIRIHTRGAAAK